MSTKDLARTVIEGGRYDHDKYDRRMSLRYWRRDNRRFCAALAAGAADWDETPAPVRDVWWRFRDEIHADRTHPCERFLASRAGRRWDDVRSEIHAKFGTKTLAGRHVVYAHLVDRVLNEMQYAQIYAYYAYAGTGAPKFWVDELGVLRHNPKRRY